MAAVYMIAYPSDRARARRLERSRRALNRAATEQEEPYIIDPFRYAQLRRVSHWISEQATEAAELVVDHIARGA